MALLVAISSVPRALAQNDERPSLRAGALGSTLRVDGVLDEPEWGAAPVASDLVMVEPRQGERAHGRGGVKVLA